MSRIKPTTRIYDVIKGIERDEYLLPSIQRSFIWEEDRICKLFDSLMNDYPIGSCLVWKPKDDPKIRTRRFLKDYDGTRHISDSESAQLMAYLVLDGQQRLQSLYLGFFGSYNLKKLFFKVDSNPEEEENDLRYQFQFSPSAYLDDPHWVKPNEIINIGIPKMSSFVEQRFKNDSTETKERIIENLSKFIQVFNIDERIYIQDVTEDLPYNDVLEVFVRVNSGGMVLKKSDLVFSTVVLNIPEMEEKFIGLVDKLNGRGEFDFDIDFIIKTSFVVFDKGAKYDVNKLRDRDYIDKLRSKFDNLKEALLSTKAFLENHAKIRSKRFLKSDLALIPIVDFIFKQPHQRIPEGQKARLRHYLYMSFFMRFYSHGADGKLDRIYKEISQSSSNSFPLEEIGRYMSERTGVVYKFSKEMLTDLDLVLNIIQGGVSEIPRHRGWSLEKDHIFPRSVLYSKDFPEELTNSIGNLRLVDRTRNIIKSDSLPAEDIDFSGREDKDLNELFLEVRNNLSKENFEAFVLKREEVIFNKVRTFLGPPEIELGIQEGIPESTVEIERGEKTTQDILILVIVLMLGRFEGKASKKHVEAEVYIWFETKFQKDYWNEITGRVPRWKKHVQFARLRALHQGFIKPPEESGRGIWELTPKGWEYYENISKKFK